MGCGHGILAHGDGSLENGNPGRRTSSISISARRGYNSALRLLELVRPSSAHKRLLHIEASENRNEWSGDWKVPEKLLGAASDECCRALAEHFIPHLLFLDEVRALLPSYGRAAQDIAAGQILQLHTPDRLTDSRPSLLVMPPLASRPPAPLLSQPRSSPLPTPLPTSPNHAALRRCPCPRLCATRPRIPREGAGGAALGRAAKGPLATRARARACVRARARKGVVARWRARARAFWTGGGGAVCVRAPQPLFHEGDPGTSLFFVNQGRCVCVYVCVCARACVWTRRLRSPSSARAVARRLP